jgi:hypothetical protein
MNELEKKQLAIEGYKFYSQESSEFAEITAQCVAEAFADKSWLVAKEQSVSSLQSPISHDDEE